MHETIRVSPMMRSFSVTAVLIKKEPSGCRDTQRKDHMEKISQGERSQKKLCPLDLGLVASRTLRIEISVV